MAPVLASLLRAESIGALESRASVYSALSLLVSLMQSEDHSLVVLNEVCLRACVCARVRVCVYTFVYVRVRAYIFLCAMCACVHGCARAYVRSCVIMCVYVRMND